LTGIFNVIYLAALRICKEANVRKIKIIPVMTFFFLMISAFAVPLFIRSLPSFALTKLEQRFIVMFPQSISDWQRKNLIDLEKDSPGRGIGITYVRPDAEAVIYVYDKKMKSIPSGPDTGTAVIENSLYKSEISGAKKIEAIEEGKVKAGSVKKTVFLFTKFRPASGSGQKTTALYLTASRGHFLKIKLDYSSSALTERTIWGFLDGVVDAIDRL